VYRKLKLVLKAIEVRLRFIVILVATGLVVGNWDSIANHWDKWTRHHEGDAVELGAGMELYCPMHPHIVRPVPEKGAETPLCPICGMPLAARKKATALPLPPGVTGRVQLSPERVRLAGITTEEIVPRKLSVTIEAAGNVVYDESRLSRIVARTSGYLEKLYVSETFRTVREGEPLALVYSPELYTAVRELRLALKSGSSGELAAGAREKLLLLGVGEPEVDEIVKADAATPRLVIRSPRGGHVIHRAVVEGAHVNAGDTLFEVADLSRVWIEGDVYEKDIPFLREGLDVEASVEAFPGKVFSGTLSLVHPHLQVETRTDQVRFALANPGHLLRPGMFATVRIAAPVAEDEVLAVPESAVIDTGTRKVVYVEREPGIFEGRLVTLGPRAGGHYPVLSGLEKGERVATAGAFLVDAETRLNPAAGSTFVGAQHGGHGK